MPESVRPAPRWLAAHNPLGDNNMTLNLIETLHLHALWLAGDPNGARANLTGADLTGANLARADLTGANLEAERNAHDQPI